MLAPSTSSSRTIRLLLLIHLFSLSLFGLLLLALKPIDVHLAADPLVKLFNRNLQCNWDWACPVEGEGGGKGLSSVAMRRLPLTYRFAVQPRPCLVAFQAAAAVVVVGRWRCRRTQFARIVIDIGGIGLLVGLHIDGRIILLLIERLLLAIRVHIHGATLQQRWLHMHGEWRRRRHRRRWWWWWL